MNLTQVANSMVSKKTEKKGVLWPICAKFKLEITYNKYVSVGKIEC